MRVLSEDGVAKAAAGATTLEEVLRVAPPDNADRASAPTAAMTTASMSAVKGAAPSAPGGRKDRVLIVEDSPTVVTVVKYFLELEGFEVLVAEDGTAGLEMALGATPDVVVSDLN